MKNPNWVKKQIQQSFKPDNLQLGHDAVSAQISYNCPHCNCEMTYSPERLGQNSQCSHCQKEIKLGRTNDFQTRENYAFQQAGVDRAFEYGGVVQLGAARRNGMDLPKIIGASVLILAVFGLLGRYVYDFVSGKIARGESDDLKFIGLIAVVIGLPIIIALVFFAASNGRGAKNYHLNPKEPGLLSEAVGTGMKMADIFVWGGAFVFAIPTLGLSLVAVVVYQFARAGGGRPK